MYFDGFYLWTFFIKSGFIYTYAYEIQNSGAKVTIFNELMKFFFSVKMQKPVTGSIPFFIQMPQKTFSL